MTEFSVLAWTAARLLGAAPPAAPGLDALPRRVIKEPEGTPEQMFFDREELLQDSSVSDSEAGRILGISRMRVWQLRAKIKVTNGN